MTDPTPLDLAHAAMTAAPEDEAARRAFYDRLAASELFLMLAADPGDAETVTPEIFDLGEASYVLAFDREERLAAFAGRAVAHVALSGRALAGMLSGQEIGLGLNLETGPSAILLPPDALAWLHETLGAGPEETEARIARLDPPAGLPEALLAALDARLAAAAGLAEGALLAGVVYATGTRGHLLALLGAPPEAHRALAQAVSDALALSGLDAAALDVIFLAPTDPLAGRLERVGLRFDLPERPRAVTQARPAPGMDPDRPPRLK